MASANELTSDPDAFGIEIARLATFLVHLDGYWESAQDHGLPQQRRRVEAYLVAAHRRIAELCAPLAGPPRQVGAQACDASLDLPSPRPSAQKVARR
jgi:hypothetical protein